KAVYYKSIKNSIKESAIIITLSEHSKKDLLEIFDIMPDKIVVTYPPLMLKPLASKETMHLFLKKYSLRPRQYMLFVGAIEPRKNVGRLIDAYSSLNTSMPLVIAGNKAWLYEKELARNLKNVLLLGHVPADDLRYLYGGAFCFVFPSLYEGFGLPPLEAMAFGCPVITSNVASLPEVCGDAALYVDPYNTKDITEAIETLLTDKKMRTELAEAGKERAKIFSMQNYIKKLYKAYKKVV
ncbi:MAG: glycosyltransferase family 4 protein, partial [Promethearchaeota archaeon]